MPTTSPEKLPQKPKDRGPGAVLGDEQFRLEETGTIQA